MTTLISDFVIVEDTVRKQVIAEGKLGEGVLVHEGNYYFDPKLVNMENLTVTDKLYICPYRGTANNIDFEAGHGVIEDVAWVYRNPNTGYEQIAGYIGFYTAGHHPVVARPKEIVS